MCHSQSCFERLAAYQDEIKTFESKYPKYCRECGGNGGYWYSYDPSASGISLASGFMTDFESCEFCVGSGVCPQCGSNLPEDEPWICPGCDWNLDQPRPGLTDPSLLECDCCSDCQKPECDFTVIVPEVYQHFSDLYEVMP